MMEQEYVSTQIADGVALITMNDGGKNLISPNMVEQLNTAFVQAEKANAVVVLTGSNGTFSAGFDLKILRSGVANTFKMLIGGFKLTERLLSFKTPVIIACNGHAIAMGAFILLSADHRVGVHGSYKVMTNEVAIGLTMPHTGIEVSRQRLTPAYFNRAMLLSEEFDPKTAVAAGFLDELVPEDELLDHCMDLALSFTKLDLNAHYRSKLRMRCQLLFKLRSSINSDRTDLILLGLKRMFSKR